MSEVYDLKFEVSVSVGESLKELKLWKRPNAFELIYKDFQCSSTTARYLSDLVEIDPSIVLKHGLFIWW